MFKMKKKKRIKYLSEALKRENILIMQGSKLTLWITNPSGGGHKFY